MYMNLFSFESLSVSHQYLNNLLLLPVKNTLVLAFGASSVDKTIYSFLYLYVEYNTPFLRVQFEISRYE